MQSICQKFGELLYCQTNGIPIETNCVPLLADLLQYFYENEPLDRSIKDGNIKLFESSVLHIVILLTSLFLTITELNTIAYDILRALTPIGGGRALTPASCHLKSNVRDL